MQESLTTYEIGAEDFLMHVAEKSGLMWEKIEKFVEELKLIEGVVFHECGEPQEEWMKKDYPLKQHIEGGLYTRELFMPKGHFIVGMIHKQEHPTFLLKGELSYLTDDGKVVRIKAPYRIFTQIGTQRLLYMHKDSIMCCVFKSDAKTFEEAEEDVFTSNYKTLPIEIIERKALINKNKELCLEI